jgi:F420-dependent oxidoreductase-like protein
MIGAFVQGRDAKQIVDSIESLDRRGIPAAWLTMGGVAPDAPTIFAAAAMKTDSILLGTSIIPTWPRHPIAIAQQALGLAQLAPGRFRLGIGPSHQPSMENLIGVRWRKPLLQLREYLTVISTLLRTGSVDFKGEHVTARGRIAAPVEVTIMASALREGSFRLCGELADGAISWVAPWSYLREKALPALKEGAAAAGRTPPPLIAHVPICVHTSADEVRQAAREQIGYYGRVPFYAAMYAAAGYQDVSGGPPDALIDDLVIYGSEGEVVDRLRRIIAEGAGEIIAHPILAGPDRSAALNRAFDAIAAANQGG